MKRVLIISYYWLPAGGISIIRPLKLAKYLQTLVGSLLFVLQKIRIIHSEDNTAGLGIPKDLEIIKVPILEPYEIYKKLTGQKRKVSLG